MSSLKKFTFAISSADELLVLVCYIQWVVADPESGEGVIAQMY